jgi:hypothetical protein
MYYMAYPFHSSWFYHRTILGEENRSLSSSLCSFLHSLVTLSRLGPTILLNTLFSNTLIQLSSLNVSNQDLDIDRVILDCMLKKENEWVWIKFVGQRTENSERSLWTW